MCAECRKYEILLRVVHSDEAREQLEKDYCWHRWEHQCETFTEAERLEPYAEYLRERGL